MKNNLENIHKRYYYEYNLHLFTYLPTRLHIFSVSLPRVFPLRKIVPPATETSHTIFQLVVII